MQNRFSRPTPRMLVMFMATMLLALACAQPTTATREEASTTQAQGSPAELEYRLSGDETSIETAAQMIVLRLGRAQLRAQMTLRGDDTIIVALDESSEMGVAELKALIESPGELRFVASKGSEADALFKELGGELPEGFELKTVFGDVHTITHNDVDALRSFLAERGPAGADIAFEFHPAYIEMDGDQVLGHQPRYVDGEKTFWSAHLLTSSARLTGAHLESVTVQMDGATNRPYVDLRFSQEGARILADLSKELVGQPMAIVIGDEVIMAPVVAEPITGGRLMIDLGHPGTERQLTEEALELERRFQTHMPIAVEPVR